MKKAEKIFFVSNLTEELKSAKSVILVNYAGLSVKAQQELKKRLTEVGAKMLVVKNTLLKRAGEAAKIEPEVLTDTVLSGQTALILAGEDAIASLSVLGKFAKEFEVPSLKVGIVDGSFQDTDSLIKLSNLPGKDALLGQLLGTLMGTSYGLVGTLNANTQRLLFVLNEKAKS
ncbi:50S ribosomal protein L10 [Candidatus Woesebacteria bacterium RBG_19FT_COMBO_42_9]|uniref:Large ribosomal subunit protein uL10 n=1 Tax=Candidatus Woesebacteria bacterium RBG_16_42_24 TaxID=1802485 RepID=A0A1F7XJR8_9BACT|nr:MAG: 50S ribosomal protein L10 [Candidatus Woesebacteria bacterium RBG_16_42_24]OGM17785.1 MAG: 50S ribosomal protein L10 [Candidatus Woesebacteria bacterium RBG_19FT_COMBO_42_9]OGM67650.1 MAG: 50S ribosomal protein L10 [Candidatus Woesebacteria bacterium RIFCSPLOWO2_01_FULL_43_11]